MEPKQGILSYRTGSGHLRGFSGEESWDMRNTEGYSQAAN